MQIVVIIGVAETFLTTFGSFNYLKMTNIKTYESGGEVWVELTFKDEQSYNIFHQQIQSTTHICNKESLSLNINAFDLIKVTIDKLLETSSNV